jgi:tRNA (guanine37-N1)-methyltransferase
MLSITIISVFPELHETFCRTSLPGRAAEAGLVNFSFIRLADCVAPKERIDTPACGPGAGMVIKAEVLERAMARAVNAHGPGTTVFFSPQGELLTQKVVREFAQGPFPGLEPGPSNGSQRASDDAGQASMTEKKHLILFCGRYEGIDERAQEHFADHVFSIGDYVLMGGDLPAQVFLEAALRYLPGVVGKGESVEHDSFTGPFVDYPAYGLPVEWQEKKVPEIVRSGDHGKIERWRKEIACSRTVEKRFQWLRSTPMTEKDVDLVADTLPPHYAVLMHDQVMIGRSEKKPGTTSVTTIDLHDIARSCTTYGIKKFFVVTPLEDQQKLLEVFFQFWHSDKGKTYNTNRYDAMSRVVVVSSLDEVRSRVMQENNEQRPLLIATSALNHGHPQVISYTQQGAVWQHQQPVMLLFGTGQGMTEELVLSCDYLLEPVRGFTTYNHLSVRSAVAIIFDRWLGYAAVATEKAQK